MKLLAIYVLFETEMPPKALTLLSSN